jgi:pimeloyl-ACP methyl ester carboxylesterase
VSHRDAAFVLVAKLPVASVNNITVGIAPDALGMVCPTSQEDIMIHEQRGSIDYDERGDGPTIVLVPGSCSTGTAWRPIVAEWNDAFRCVTTSLLGYGGTDERRTPETADVTYEAEILEAVIRRADRPVHLVGHSFGGTTALAVALRGRLPLRSLTIIEAPVPELLRHAGEHQHYCAFRRMTDAYFKAFPRRQGNGDRQHDRLLRRRRHIRRLAIARARLRRGNHGS